MPIEGPGDDQDQGGAPVASAGPCGSAPTSLGVCASSPSPPGPPRAAYLDLEAPRAVVRWDGRRWKPVAIVGNVAAAQVLMCPAEPGPERW
ncbi:DUF6087 family protein [Streptomyces sp. Ru73]|uniref:DUF6087 family protein n=1 Tax=Streptomyces sp. Ru73 TaxID=2080748 RepID=UPI0035BBA9A0